MWVAVGFKFNRYGMNLVTLHFIVCAFDSDTLMPVGDI